MLHSTRLLLVSSRLGYTERWRVLLFLLQNGVDPVLIVEFLQAAGSIADRDWPSLNLEIRRWATDPAWCRRSHAWDMSLGVWAPLDGSARLAHGRRH